MSTTKKQLKLEEAVIPGIALLFAAAYFIQTTDGPAEVMRWPIVTAVVSLIFVVAILAKFLFSASSDGTGKSSFSVPQKSMLILVGPSFIQFRCPTSVLL